MRGCSKAGVAEYRDPCHPQIWETPDLWKIWVELRQPRTAALLSVTLSRLLTPPAEPTSILIRSRDVPGRPEIRRPVEIADRLDRLFPDQTATEPFATLIHGVLDVATLELRQLAAGHPGPLHLLVAGSLVILESPGFPIGLAEEADGERYPRLSAGDRLSLYSDGLPDVMSPSGERFGEARVLEAITRRRAEPLDEGIVTFLDELSAWRGGNGPRGDISVLAVEIAGAP